jgi:rubredoxin
MRASKRKRVNRVASLNERKMGTPVAKGKKRTHESDVSESSDSDDDSDDESVASSGSEQHGDTLEEPMSDVGEDDRCRVCGDGKSLSSNLILYCDGCDIPVHQACYDVVNVPDGDWFCRRCEAAKAKEETGSPVKLENRLNELDHAISTISTDLGGSSSDIGGSSTRKKRIAPTVEELTTDQLYDLPSAHETHHEDLLSDTDDFLVVCSFLTVFRQSPSLEFFPEFRAEELEASLSHSSVSGLVAQLCVHFMGSLQFFQVCCCWLLLLLVLY